MACRRRSRRLDVATAGLKSARVFVLLSMLGTAYMAHWRAGFFNEIGRSKPKFSGASATACG